MSYLTDEETETQRGEVTCLRSHNFNGRDGARTLNLLTRKAVKPRIGLMSIQSMEVTTSTVLSQERWGKPCPINICPVTNT